MQYLVDTGIWLRLFDHTDPQQLDIRTALGLIRSKGHTLAVCPQNIAEFWNVSTRPTSARGGYGKNVATTQLRVQFIERHARMLVESFAAYQQWRDLLIQYRIQGVAVHDARLVSMMQNAGVRHILTLNGSDFVRYTGITVVSPKDINAISYP